MRMAIEFEQFEECDGVPRGVSCRTSWEGVLHDFLASGMQCAVTRLDSRNAATNACHACRQAATRYGLPVVATQRGKGVYLSRTDGGDADGAR